MTRFLWSFAIALAWQGVARGAAQDEVEIVHDPIQCWPVDQFLMLRSTFAPPEDIQTAKFYFRSTDHLDYYYVEMTLGPGGGVAIGPKAEPTTAGVTYYIELITRSYSSYRTDEREVPVASGDECRRRDPETAFYSGQNPDIAVGATRVGTPSLPPGFQPDGITRFLNATGIAAESGGGVSGRTIAIIGGLGGAGAAALALSGGGSSNSTTSSPIGGSTSSVVASSTSTAIGGGSSSTTTTTGGGSSTSSVTTTIGGGSSTTTVLGSTTTIVGSTTTVVGSSTSTVITSSTTTVAGSTTTSSPTTTTSPPTTTTSSPTTTTSSPTTTTSTASTTTTIASTTTTSTPPSSTTTSAAGSTTDIVVTKSASPGTVNVGGRIFYRITVRNNGPADATQVAVEDDLPPGVTVTRTNPACGGPPNQKSCALGTIPAGGSRTVEIDVIANTAGRKTNSAFALGRQVDPNMNNNSASVSTQVNQVTTEREAEPFGFESELRLSHPDQGATGSIVLNDSTMLQVRSGPPVSLRAGAGPGIQRFEGRFDAGSPASGSWRFSFAASRRLVPGSLRVESGEVLLLSGDTIVFSLRPSSAPIRFSLELQ